MRRVFRHRVLCHVIPDVVQLSLIGPPASSLSLQLHVYHLLGGILPFLLAIPSESSLPDEGCYWFDVGFSPADFILDVVLLGFAC